MQINKCPKCNSKFSFLYLLKNLIKNNGIIKCYKCSSKFKESDKYRFINRLVFYLPIILISPNIRNFLKIKINNYPIELFILCIFAVLWLIFMDVISLLWTKYREFD